MIPTVSRFFTVFSSCIYQLCSDLDSLKYATRSVLQDFQDDGVRYLELRTTPRANEAHGISKDKYVETVLETIHDFKNDQMSTYLILSIDRSNTASQALDVVDLAIKYKSKGIVGIDLCGNPTKGDVSIFDEAFAKARNHGLKLTLHFAESTHSSSLKELNTLMSYQPSRLGHVIHVPDGIKDEIARRRLGLELCLSCNVHAKLISGGFPDHHFGYWRHQDCPIILGTDDVGFFCSPLSNEYLLAAEHFDLDRSTLIDLCKKGVDAIFGDDEEKDRLRRLLSQFEAESVL
ncbi:hypothetical protein FQN54_009034 [Arachnomyces sp. PD_36]|nr:hypothetical protein FQN54_009034 [Arachnomyces sp. PD_36]